MSSTNKTENIRLNSWIGSDVPQRADFNYDNILIDKAIGEHTGDTEIHITQAERENWSTFVKAGMYFGNGSVERTIDLECDFDISLVIIFANNRPMSIVRFSDSKNYNYTAFVGRYANTMGAKFTSDYKSIVVNQSASAVINNEYANLNESGVAYTYILFR
jgi:hypothetical protein